MRGCRNYAPEYLILHGFPAHDIDIFTTAIIIDMIEAMWVGKSCLAHIKISRSLIHKIDKLLSVEFNAFIVLSQVDASNF
jgi:hypothetical protein